MVLQLPAGRFILRDILYIERSDFILRGAGSGPGGTVLEIPVALKDLRRPEALDELQEYLIRGDKREKKTGYFFSVYSWMGGFIWPRVPGKRIYPYLAEFDTPSEILALASTGKRGDHPSRSTAASRLRSAIGFASSGTTPKASAGPCSSICTCRRPSTSARATGRARSAL